MPELSQKIVLIAVIAALLAPARAGRSAEPEQLSARQILDRVDDLYRGQSSEGEMSMKVVTEHWTREMTMRFWSKGKDKSLVRILSPKKEEGTATLRDGDNIWNYLPKIRRTIKVPSSMMGSSWMGSHFTNDDLVKESRMADDYDFHVSYRGKRDGVEVIEITCTPKPQAAVVWGEILVRVRRADIQPLEMIYYDEDMEKARTMTFSDFKKMGDRLIPTVMRVVPADKPGEYTEVRYLKIRFDLKLADSVFSLRNLER